jgi:hypothetical protein
LVINESRLAWRLQGSLQALPVLTISWLETFLPVRYSPSLQVPSKSADISWPSGTGKIKIILVLTKLLNIVYFAFTLIKGRKRYFVDVRDEYFGLGKTKRKRPRSLPVTVHRKTNKKPFLGKKTAFYVSRA